MLLAKLVLIGATVYPETDTYTNGSGFGTGNGVGYGCGVDNDVPGIDYCIGTGNGYHGQPLSEYPTSEPFVIHYRET